MEELEVVEDFDAAHEVERRITFLAEYLKETGLKGYVLGISGGVDSTVAGRLSQLACEKVREDGGDATFVAMRLPYQVQADEDDAQDALSFIDADQVLTVNIGASTDAMWQAVGEADDDHVDSYTEFVKGNVKARARMIAQYAIAGDAGLLVVGTDHGAESVTGFFTKFGDGGADLLPLYGLNKRQIRQLLQHLGAPEPLWQKVPTADLLDGKPLRTDEDELGIAYDAIDDYLEGREIPVEVAEQIEQKWWRSRHKRATPASLVDPWWR